MAYGSMRLMNGNKSMVVKKDKPKGKKEISESMMNRLKEHSKLHKGGMRSRHMKNMKKFIMEGKSFNEAHKMAVKLDKK